MRPSELRWKKLWREIDLRVVLGLAAAMLLHGVLLLWLLRPGSGRIGETHDSPQDETLRLQLRFVPPRPLAPPPPMPPKRREPTRIASAPAVESIPTPAATRSNAAPVASSAGVVPSSSGNGVLQLLNADGSIRMAPAALTPRAGNVADMRHFQQAPCKGTRFMDTWTRGQDEALGAEMARKYLSHIGPIRIALYNPEKEAEYQQHRTWHDAACAR